MPENDGPRHEQCPQTADGGRGEATYAYGPVRNTGWHVMGTCRMGDNPSQAVVDATGACHGVDNLFIADSSVFPTGSCVNPANTIQALALWISASR